LCLLLKGEARGDGRRRDRLRRMRSREFSRSQSGDPPDTESRNAESEKDKEREREMTHDFKGLPDEGVKDRENKIEEDKRKAEKTGNKAESEKEEDIQSAFLNWLHAQSHQPLTCLTGRTNVILLPCAEGVRKNPKN